MKNLFLEKINNGEKPIGLFSELRSPYAVECMGIAGMDYVVIDMEHGPSRYGDAVEEIKAANLRGMTPFVRVPSSDRASVLPLLDAGAMGLIVPCVQGLENVKQLIKFCKYPPAGERGLAFGRSSGWGCENWVTNLGTYFSVCNREQLLIPQCETVGCLNELESIVVLDEVAGIFIGPFDLSAAMGSPGAVNTPEFKETICRIKDVCHAAGKFCMMFVASPTEASAWLEMGMDSVAVGMDAILYINMCKEIITNINNA